MQWRIEDSQPPVWEHTNSMMSAWKSGIRDGTRNPTMRIPSLQVTNKILYFPVTGHVIFVP
jgi:hypothetical protein